MTDPGMNDSGTEIHLLDYWRIVRRRMPLALAFFAVVVTLVGVYAFMATPIYQGTAQVLVDLEKNQTLNFVEGAPVIQMRDSVEFFNTQKTILGSRLFADKLVRKLQLDKNPYFLERKRKQLEAQGSGINSLKQSVSGLFPERGKPLATAPDLKLDEELNPGLTDIVLLDLKADIPRQSNVMRISYTATPGLPR